ncbi:MAG: hypothetical protein IT467_07585 [Dokdonella sp.]|nr:hypothetical protein [Dokdonella sp.]
MRTLRICLVVALAGLANPVQATKVPIDGGEAVAVRTEQQNRQRERLQVLRSDSSPRVQVLAGDIWLDSEDPATRLLPKPKEVMARAVQLAPDDAFVQWFAADHGSYTSSQCGPTTWPETEVANLTRLEADNAAAWQYAVALAVAKGDATGIDTALAQMAAARRADDHQGELVRAWAKLHAQHPDWQKSEYFVADAEDDTPRIEPSLRAALLDAARYGSAVDDALEGACKPDASSDTAWQRLGWCVRAGELLAGKGSSFNLRETGMKMLAAAGATNTDLADARRELQWLSENAATPQRNYQLLADGDEGLSADWRDAKGDIAATQHRLARLSLPLTPPAGWVSATERAQDENTRAMDAMTSYMNEVIADLQASSDLHERAMGLFAKRSFGQWFSGADDADDKSAAPAPDTALADLAAAHPDDAFVQRLALDDSAAREEATKRLQGLEPDNAFVWLLDAGNAGPAGEALHKAAAARRYDDGSMSAIKLLHAAFLRHPAPAGMREMAAHDEAFDVGVDFDKVFAFANAASLAMTSNALAPARVLAGSCSKNAVAGAASLRTDCIEVARLLLRDGASLLTSSVGAQVLLGLAALEGAEREQARRIAWWREQGALSAIGSMAYVNDYLDKGEMAAIRAAATRAGKAEPPADWQPKAWATRNPVH